MLERFGFDIVALKHKARLHCDLSGDPDETSCSLRSCRRMISFLIEQTSWDQIDEILKPVEPWASD